MLKYKTISRHLNRNTIYHLACLLFDWVWIDFNELKHIWRIFTTYSINMRLEKNDCNVLKKYPYLELSICWDSIPDQIDQSKLRQNLSYSDWTCDCLRYLASQDVKLTQTSKCVRRIHKIINSQLSTVV